MNEAQEKFDEHLQPACPSQLTSPVLHKLLAYEPIQSPPVKTVRSAAPNFDASEVGALGAEARESTVLGRTCKGERLDGNWLLEDRSLRTVRARGPPDQ